METQFLYNNEVMSEKKVLLVVDDESTNIDLLVGLLKEDYKIKVALNGERAIKIAQKSLPNLILLDVIMPGINGYEVCQTLKKDPETANLPIVLVTGNAAEEDIQKGAEAGALETLAKPIDPEKLFAAIEKYST